MNINELVGVFRKHLHVSNNHLIYVPMAMYLSRTLEGDPIWLVPFGPSGYGKTEFIKPYLDLSFEEYNILSIDQLTPKSFNTVVKGAKPLGEKLNDKNTMIVISDLANILSLREDDRNEILSQFRTLYDGVVKRDTGSGNADWTNIHTNFIGFSTPHITRDLRLGSIMGTREILYRLPKIEHLDRLIEKNITTEGRKEISNAVKKFIDTMNKQWVEPDTETKKKLWGMAYRISIWRVEAICDNEGYLLEPVEAEIPKRLFIQLKKLWMSFFKMGLSEKEITKILNEIEFGTGNILRNSIYERLTTIYNALDGREMNGPNEATIKDLAVTFNTSASEVRKQLMILCSLNKVELMSENYHQDSKWRGIPW